MLLFTRPGKVRVARGHLANTGLTNTRWQFQPVLVNAECENSTDPSEEPVR